jgi:serine/threonine-protein kinase
MTSSANAIMQTPPEGFDLSGQTLDDYRILRKLGQGGMGQVYLAEQLSLKRKVALKILPRDEAALRPDALLRFKAEAEAVARAVHANILQVYAYGEVEGMPYMALEYVEGRNLKEDVALKGPPDEAKAIRIMRQVASALQRASELGIIHRDIKPENILLARTGDVKVADFGLARLHTEGESVLKLTQSGVTMGTPLYMSPEQIEGKPLDSRTDIYSFGATCYHMLTGQPPFRGETALSVALQHLSKEPSPLASARPDLPAKLCDVVHAMMAKKPEDRYQTARDVMRELNRLRPGFDDIGEEEGGASSVPLVKSEVPSTADSPTRTHALLLLRRRWVVGVLLILSFLAAALLGGALARWSQRGSARKVRPDDTGTAQLSQGERDLREAVENAADADAALKENMQLALIYLDEYRLDEAEKLFGELQTEGKPPAHQRLGQLGSGIVQALRNEAEESNKRFVEVFKNTDELKPVLAETKWREWIGRARWFNHENGLHESKVPDFLKKNFAVSSKKDKKNQGPKPTQPKD